MLAVRARGNDAYGVTVQQTIEASASRRVTLGAVYSALERLERKQLVRSRMGGGEAKQGGRRKRLFRLTSLGIDTLASARDARDVLWGLAEVNDG